MGCCPNTILALQLFEISSLGLPWWFSGYDSMLPLQGAQLQTLFRELRSTCHQKQKKRGRGWTTLMLSPVEKSLANLISSWKNTVTQWSSMLDFREVISEPSCLHPLGLVWKKQQSRDHICLPNPSILHILPGTYCVLDKQLWMNKWMGVWELFSVF